MEKLITRLNTLLEEYCKDKLAVRRFHYVNEEWNISSTLGQEGYTIFVYKDLGNKINHYNLLTRIEIKKEYDDSIKIYSCRYGQLIRYKGNSDLMMKTISHTDEQTLDEIYNKIETHLRDCREYVMNLSKKKKI